MLAVEQDQAPSVVKPAGDPSRLAALHRYQVLDTPSCQDFTFLTELAAKVCDVPYSFISLVDSERVWVKSYTGLPVDELPRDQCYCSLAVLGDSVTEIPDLSQDYRTAAMPLTVNAPHLRMYSGVALMSSDGYAIGTLCVMDSRPGLLNEAQRRMLLRLARQVMALIELRANEKALKSTVHELELLATTDELTGLYNRRALLAKLKFETARSRRFRTPLAAVMIDIDHFKRINDRHGHAAGDMVLRNLGRMLREHVRVIDIPGRYGGEELCVVLPNTPLEGACKLAETLRLRIEAQVHELNGEVLRVTASLGVAAFDHLVINDAESLLRHADEALYRAKHGGRNRVVC